MTSNVVQENTAYHSQLLDSIAKLDYVPSALAQQDSYLKGLDSQLSQTLERLKKLEEKTKKERAEHQAIRDSVAKRWAHKLTGRREKFEAKESKEEREYVEALEKELAERDSLNVLRQIISEAKDVHSELSEKNGEYESLKKELADLYSRVFDGPSQDFPEDDRLEKELQDAQGLHNSIQTTLNAECQAAEILSRADDTMSFCQNKMQEALEYSEWDIWGGGGLSDLMEHNALSQAESLANQAQMLCEQAQAISPFVKPIGPLVIAQGSILSDVFFDNIFTDLAFHNKIEAAADDVDRVHNQIKAGRDAAWRRADTAGSQLISAAQELENRRKALDSFRRETFRRMSRKTDEPNELGRLPNVITARRPFSDMQSAPLNAISAEPGRRPSPEGPQSEFHLPSYWGSRNPYAAALARRSSSHLYEEETKQVI